MSNPFIAEIKIFAGNFAPRSFAFCNGQLLPISQNTALFALIGTTYGGDGRTTTALPNMQDRIPMHPGRGPGLTSRRLGEKGGATTATLNATQIANHIHGVRATNAAPNASSPAGALPAMAPVYEAGTGLTPMSSGAMTATGGSSAHNNAQPTTALNFIIALQGTFPSRS